MAALCLISVGMSWVVHAHVFTLDAAHSSAVRPQLEDSSKGVDVPLGSRRRPAAGVDMEGSLEWKFKPSHNERLAILSD